MANTILTESLNAILRTKRHLFVSPLEWTEEHSKLFRVEWNNDGGSSSSSSRTYGPSDIQPHQTIMVELPEMPPTDFIQRIKILGRNRPPGDKYAAMHGLLLPTRDDVSNSYRWQAQCKRTIRCISSFPNRGLQLVFGKGTRSPVKKSLPCGSLYSVSDSSHTQIFAYIDVADINEARWKEKIKQKRRHYRRPQINKPQTPANARDPCIIGVLLAMAQDRAQEQWASNKSQFLAQVLVTDGSTHCHLHTASVSRTLLQSFHRPDVKPLVFSTPDSDTLALITVNDREIPFEPYETFRERLTALLSQYESIQSCEKPNSAIGEVRPRNQEMGHQKRKHCESSESGAFPPDLGDKLAQKIKRHNTSSPRKPLSELCPNDLD